MSKHKSKPKNKGNAVVLPVSGLSAVELARKHATTAPQGTRLGGPGTRSKNPSRYDKISAQREATQ